MNPSREYILNKIRALRQEVVEAPIIPEFEVAEDLVSTFKISSAANKGEVIDREAFVALLESGQYPRIYSTAKGFESYTNITVPQDPHEFSDLSLAVVEGQFGVAENGAIWLDEENLEFRILPFITEHLVILLDKKKLVGNMHQAYAKIGNTKSGFGLFTAGPSKTADIEQSLVIGAHGAKSLKIVMI
ncbi:LutC/YkgG family protein [Anditalea andensis]|uniref:LUD domain-containing protein n=1 Tax=Anditalea andensis TaxID=1048983 RepID=A0A074LP73_9BACT|nr:LUD domain-containing protein [Anditalea andensis]KEO75712.1 hypothetical protein EL17_22045 [Anditalea andensis]